MPGISFDPVSADRFAQGPPVAPDRHRRRTIPAALATAVLWVGVVGLTAPPAAAATITVTSSSDSPVLGQCTLREAIIAANTDVAVGGCAAGSGADTITFAPEVVGVIQLLSTLPSMSTAVTISGPGADVLSIRGDRAAEPNSGVRNISITHTAVATLSGVTIEQIQGDFGGAIGNHGTLTLSGVTLSGSQAAGLTAPNSVGGGVANAGTLTVVDSAIVDNDASFGGGIYNEGTLSVVNSTLTDNEALLGGGLANAGTASLTHTTLATNLASSNDGGIHNIPPASTTLRGSIVAGNTVGSLGEASRSNCGPGVGDGGNNLSFGGACGFSTANGSLLEADPLLGPLSENGGPTHTRSPQTSSPAIDAIPVVSGACATPVAADQRGVSRPQGPGCDIGAVEVTVQTPPDTTAPTITVTTPADKATYLLNESIRADYSCTDEQGGSGVATCEGAVSTGDPIDTGTVGAKQFSVSSTDNAGNDSTKHVDYRVAYAFSGFSAPVETEAVSLAKAGRTVPFKFTILDANNVPITNLTSATTSAVRYTCAAAVDTDVLEEYAAGQSGLQNLGEGNYQFNFQTKKTWTGCWTLGIDLGDGVLRTADFQFR